MHRRAFLKIAGGGVIGAGLPAMANTATPAAGGDASAGAPPPTIRSESRPAWWRSARSASCR